MIIDCLEFSRALRLLDPADEIAFLALECERLGGQAHAATVIGAYREIAQDPIAPELLHFCASFRAWIRARLAVWHLKDPALQQEKWRGSALNYLALAQRHLDGLA